MKEGSVIIICSACGQQQVGSLIDHYQEQHKYRFRRIKRLMIAANKKGKQ